MTDAEESMSLLLPQACLASVALTHKGETQTGGAPALH